MGELQVWAPSPFDGDDLLPVALGARKVDDTGRQNIEPGDLIFPTLKMLQGSSEEVKQGVDGAKAGLFWLTGVNEVFKPPIRVLACAHTKSRTLFPKPDRPEHAGLQECLSRDGRWGSSYGDCVSCSHKDWDSVNSRPPACSESHNFTVLTPMGPAIIRFARTSIKSARNFLTAWRMSPDTLWSHPIVITTKIRTDMVNGRPSTTHVMEMRWLMRENVPPDVQAAARTIYDQVMTANVEGRFDNQQQNGVDTDDVPY